jgi:class 3 adenylate cyclase
MDVGEWLRKLGLEQYEPTFRENRIDSQVLPKLTAEDLKDLGITLVGDRRRLLEAIALFRCQPEVVATGPQTIPTGLAETADERRQVAILFADLCGFTTLSTRLDAEDLRRLVEGFYTRADAIITQYGGAVDKHIGDAVMALFGAPIAHGDDALRAVRAALDIQTTVSELIDPWGKPLASHIGIAAGEVVAGGVGRGYSVLGDAVNLAARLVELASPGETVISEPSARLLEGKIRVTALPPASLKGIDGSVIGWRVEGLATETAPPAPFVGRQSDLLMLKGLLQACEDSSRGRVIVLRGEAGIGKSRLLGEISREAQERGFAVHKASVLDFGTGRARTPCGCWLGASLVLPRRR